MDEKTEAEASKELFQDHQQERTKSQTRCQILETMLLITALLISILIKMLYNSDSLSLIHLTEHFAHRQDFHRWKGSGDIFQVKVAYQPHVLFSVGQSRSIPKMRNSFQCLSFFLEPFPLSLSSKNFTLTSSHPGPSIQAFPWLFLHLPHSVLAYNAQESNLFWHPWKVPQETLFSTFLDSPKP